jgi:ribosomal protein L32
MTSKEAVEILRKIKVYATGDGLEALDMAIESIIHDYARGVQKGLEIATVNGSDKRKPGHWIPQDLNKSDGMTTTAVYYFPKCSVCGHTARPTNFCPSCGSDMRQKEGASK